MKFTVYSKKGCPYCEKIQKVLEITDLDHVVYFLDEHFSKEDFLNEFGKDTSFPQVILDDSVQLGGCTETVKYLKEKEIIK